MPFPGINAFKEQLLDGGARPSLFTMEVTWPVSIPVGTAAALKLPWHCRIAEIPGKTQNPIIFKYAGREVKFAGQTVFDNLRLTIINDEAYTVRRALDTWMEYINTRETNIALTQASPTAAGYAGTGVVKQWGKDGTVKQIYTFVDMFPQRVDPIPLDWGQDAQIEDYSVEFAYQYWTPGNLSSAIGSIAGAAING